MTLKDWTEDAAVKQTAIDIFTKLYKGYNFSYLDLQKETFNIKKDEGTVGRNTKDEVILIKKLKQALITLNEGITDEEITLTIQELKKDRKRLSAIAANKEIYKMIKDGIKITIKKNGKYEKKTIKIIDFNPQNNEFFLASEFWVTGEYGSKRADLILFVNGIPLIVMEFKRTRHPVREAYDKNISDYKDTIPQLFWYNAFILISNGKDTEIGTMTGEFEDYFHWKKVLSEDEKGNTLIDTAINGCCEPNRFFDIFENFILYETKRKLIAKYHQYLGVNNLIKAFEKRKSLKGKLGVYWHTQRAGKTNSMVFFSQKILRKFSMKYTFVLVTDRESLDKQIYQDFGLVEAITEVKTQAKDGQHLKKLLKEDHRLVFTIINKFNTKKGEKYPVLSTREDIIVITDEAHRTQYDIFAMNMRNALPNASFIGFTGTPLMLKGNEKTRQVFGDYVSVYNFKDAIDDNVTVRLFYDNRSDPLKLDNPQINKEMYDIIDQADLTAEGEKKLSQEFSKDYHIITRDERLEDVAKDIVDHYTTKGYGGKSLVISIDRFTTVKMHDKVQKYWKERIKFLKESMKGKDYEESTKIAEKIQELEKTDMAVVVSKSQNEIKLFEKEGMDIRKHRKRIESEDLEKKFKNPDDPLSIVFVCHMWLTGFNVPCLSTLYIDKPMQNQTLMQAISRPATATSDKKRAFLISYLDIFKPLKRALSLYAAPRTSSEGIFALYGKEVLIAELEKKIQELNKELKSYSIDYEKLIQADGAKKLKLLKELEEKGIGPIVANDETKKAFLAKAKYIIKLYNDCKPDKALSNFINYISFYKEIIASINALDPEIDVSHVVRDLKYVLDKSIKVKGGEAPYKEGALIDLTNINLDKIKQIKKEKNNVQIQKLKNNISYRINKLVKLNPLRTDYLEKFQALIDDYNLGTLNQDFFLEELFKWSKKATEEEKRHVKEGLTEEELAVFDLLKKEDLTDKEINDLKKIAKDLLHALKNDGLRAVDWRKKPQTKAQVFEEIEGILDDNLSEAYNPIFDKVCSNVFQHIFDNYFGEGKSTYSQIA